MTFYGLEYPTRLACDVLDEARICHKTHNYAPIPSLIEELQIMFNRMEAALQKKKAISDAEDYITKLKKQIKKLERETE